MNSMKGIILGLIATVFIGFNSKAQTSKESWLLMIENHKVNVDRILNSDKPEDVELNKFKENLFIGKSVLSEKSNAEISNLNEPLKRYGIELARKLNITDFDESDLISLALFPPDISIGDDEGIYYTTNGDITGQEVFNCALIAIGADLLYSAGGVAGGVKWTVKAITKVVKSIGVRFLGPLGVGIAVGTFGYCIYQASLD